MIRRPTAQLLLVTTLAIILQFRVSAADDLQPVPESHTTNNSSEHLSTRKYQLQFVAVSAAAKAINATLKTPQQDSRNDGVIVRATLVVVPHEKTNTLVVVADDEQQERISQLLEKMDAFPPQVEIDCVITQVSADGKRDVLSRPRVRTLDSQTASIAVGEPHGERLEVSITPKVFQKIESRIKLASVGHHAEKDSSNVILLNTLKSITQARRAVLENIANARTIGYKKNLPRFDENGVSVTREVSQGELIRTGRRLDVAISGEGYFQVQDFDGRLLYTRRGNLQLTANGEIALNSGQLLQPGFTVPQGVTDINIAPNGEVTGKSSGTSDTLMGQIQLYTFVNPEGLLRTARGLFSETDSSGTCTPGTPGSVEFGEVRGGYLECSNVTLEEEARILEELLAYEAQVQSALDIAKPWRSERPENGAIDLPRVVQANHQTLIDRLISVRQKRLHDRISVSYDISTLPLWQQAASGKYSLQASLLISAIKSSVEPESWDKSTLIRQHGGSLLVTHTQEVQKKVAAFLRTYSRDGIPPEPEELATPVFE